jgi:hypothetical protein
VINQKNTHKRKKKAMSLPGRVIYEESEFEPGSEEKLEKKRNWFYHIGLFEADGQTQVFKKNGAFCTYKGITCDFKHRLLQHCQILAGGASSTKRMMGSKEQVKVRVWKFLYLIGDFTETHAKQFEPSTKSDMKSQRTEALSLELRNKLKNLKQTDEKTCILSSIAATFESLNMNPWVEKGPDARTVPLTIYWGETKFKPHLPAADYLPSYIQETLVTPEQKKQMLEITSTKAKRWNILPYP